jgi:hypothetical protein
MSHKTNKKDYILLSGELNDRTGNFEIHNIAESFGKPVTNTTALKLRDFATYDNMKIMISLYKHKNIQTCAWSARNSKAVLDYLIANRKLSELSPDVRDYLISDIGLDHFFFFFLLRFPPKWLCLSKSAASKENIIYYKIRLHNIESIR